MSVFSISDLHLSLTVDKPMNVFGGNWDNYLESIVADWDSKVSDGDIVLIGGDISWAMKLNEAEEDLKFIDKLKGKKVIIRGNHDYWWSSLAKIKEILPESIYVVQNNAVKIDNYVIAGTRGWTVATENANDEDIKIYNREQQRLILSLEEAIKLKTDEDKLICMMHFPPFNVKFDDSAFTDIIGKYKVDSVIYGHLHGSNARCEKVVVKNNIKYYLTSCDQVDNKLVKIF